MWKQGPLSMCLNGHSKAFQNQNTVRNGNQSGCHPSCKLERWPSHLHITPAQRALHSECKADGPTAGSAPSCHEAGLTLLLPLSLHFYLLRVALRSKQNTSIKEPVKLWNTYINVETVTPTMSTEEVFIKSKASHKQGGEN